MAKGEEQVCVFYDRNEALNWLGLETLPGPVEAKAKKLDSADAEKRKKTG